MWKPLPNTLKRHWINAQSIKEVKQVCVKQKFQRYLTTKILWGDILNLDYAYDLRLVKDDLLYCFISGCPGKVILVKLLKTLHTNTGRLLTRFLKAFLTSSSCAGWPHIIILFHKWQGKYLARKQQTRCRSKWAMTKYNLIIKNQGTMLL